MKIRRNQICPLCNSGKKYKKCCGSPLREKPVFTKLEPDKIPPEVKLAFDRHEANELIRKQQQGLGRPIVSFKDHDQQVVAVGETLYFSSKWKTFPDFLSDYMKMLIGSEWGNNELKKPFEERHIILQWYDGYCRYQGLYQKAKGEIFSAPTTGLVTCYLGLAYNLYLLKHNVELQQRFIDRLKDVEQFQGAYYELIIANTLIRAGFTLELEDETDQENKHCEFSATSLTTGKKYWVEAKMRGVEGVLGKDSNTGVPQTKKDPTSNLTKQLNLALEKPADSDRLIFIDVNATSKNDGTMPEWVNQAIRRLDAKERDLPEDKKAYVFVTNVPYHRHLDEEKVELALYAHGLGINDFGKPGEKRVSQIYREKQKHIDAHNIIEFFRQYQSIPSNFDGGLSPETEAQRILIGERYFFEDVGDDGVVGEVTEAIVSETKKVIHCVVRTPDGKSFIAERPISESELEDYKRHPDAFFGKVRPAGKNVENVYELFEFFMEGYKNTSKERFLELFKDSRDIEFLKSLDPEDLRIECCERWVAASSMNKQKLNG